jgi:hypothetical protein
MSKIEDSKTLGETICLECPQCKADTKHTVERAMVWSDVYKEEGIQFWSTYQIIRCNGCDTPSFRSIHSNTDDYHEDEFGKEVLDEEERLYPERAKRTLADELYLKEDVYDVPEIIQAIYRETLAAIQHDLPTLAGIGIRAVIEAICLDLKAKEKGLAGKIDELVAKSFMTPSGAEIFHGIRLLGNCAAHETKAPNKKQLAAAMKVIDHLLLGVYVLPKEASILPKPKPKAAKKSTKTKP